MNKNNQLTDHYFELLEKYEKLEKEHIDTKFALDLYEHTMREHTTASSIFQPGGKYHKEADLPLGCSCVVEGIKWMDQKINELKDEVKGLQNKWECAVDMAAIAEIEKDKALDLRNKWYKCYMDCRNEFHFKIDTVKESLDKLMDDEIQNRIDT